MKRRRSCCSRECSSIARASKQLHPMTTVWIVFGVILALSSLVPVGVSQGTDGFISIDCGGTGSTDPETNIVWHPDEEYLDSAKRLAGNRVTISANVSLDPATAATRDEFNANRLRTAMVFIPTVTSPSKYCYILELQNETLSYLVRVSFPSSNLKAKDPEEDILLRGYSTRFYFTVDSTFIFTVELDPVSTKTVELVVTPLDENIYICLVPLEDRSSMPAISSIELRPLAEEMYRDDREATSVSADSTARGNTGLSTTYLMAVARYNFGGDESLPAIRFPADPYDRLWYTVPPASSEFTSRNSSFNLTTYNENVRFPKKAVLSAWEGLTMTSNISFKFDIKAARSLHPIPTFYHNMNFLDVNPGASDDIRFVDIFLQDGKPEIQWLSNVFIQTNGSRTAWNHKQIFSSDSPVFRLAPSKRSTRPAMINTFEIYGEFEAQTQRTSKDDALTIESFSATFQDLVDTAADPCLPVPWNWLICSLEIPPRISQINLTGLGAKGELLETFGRLDRLTALDLSNNSFYGRLPKSLENVTVRELNLGANKLIGDLPNFTNQSFTNLQTLSLRDNEFTGGLLPLFAVLQSNPSSSVSKIDLSHNRFSGSISLDKGKLRKLEVLDLSDNLLSGELDVDLFKLPALRILSLQNNRFSGTVPDEIWSSESKLQTVNLNDNKFSLLNLTTWCDTVQSKRSINASQREVKLMNNDITTVILPCENYIESLPRPAQRNLWFGSSTGFILLGESDWCKSGGDNLARRYLCRSSEFEDFWATDNSGETKRAIIIATVISGVLLLIMACIFALFLRKMWKRTKELRHIQEVLAKEDVRPPFFRYEDLKAATREFSHENELGNGAFGAVYKALLADASIVAVKLLFPTDQNVADFLKEMVLITGIKHKHLIQLKGCCVRDKKRLLVYEYAENKNLADALWGNGRSIKLTWPQRFKICVGIARGLCYLHEELQPTIIHRDIKPQNILLDKDWEAKIADFGLARPLEENSTQLATRIGGTLGYFSPEYATHGKLTEKLDVYSFGILVLEIVSGRRCIDLSLTSTPHKIYLKDWAFQLYMDGRIMNLVEKDLLANGSVEEIERVLKTALSCLHENYEKRPSMSQVVNMISSNSLAEEEAVDIVSELRDQRRMYEGLFDTVTNQEGKDKQEREDRALLRSTSTSDPQLLIELSITKAR